MPDPKALEIAIAWLGTKYPKETKITLVKDFLENYSFMSLKMLGNEDPELASRYLRNAKEWALAEGFLSFRRQDHLISDVVLRIGGPLLTEGQRLWLQLLANAPLRLYQLEQNGETGLILRDILDPTRPLLAMPSEGMPMGLDPSLVFGGRVIHYEGQNFWGQSYYEVLANHLDDLIQLIENALAEEDADEEDAPFLISDAIRNYWLWLLLGDQDEHEAAIDPVTGEPFTLIRDTYRVTDSHRFIAALDQAEDLYPLPDGGWERVYEDEGSLYRVSLRIGAYEEPERIWVDYRTKGRAEEGERWLETLVGSYLEKEKRESLQDDLTTNGHRCDNPFCPAHRLPAGSDIESPATQLHQIAQMWAEHPNPALNHQSPMDLKERTEGVDRLLNYIDALELIEERRAEAQDRSPVSLRVLLSRLGLGEEDQHEEEPEPSHSAG